MKRTISLLLISLICAPLLFPLKASAFNQNQIISDAELTDWDSMSIVNIQTFLQKKNSYLAYYYANDVDGAIRTGAEVIWRAAKQYLISPRIILALLQKEQSLIENPRPTQYNLDWATGYARCDDYTVCNPEAVAEHKGFANQVDDAAGWFRWFLDNNGRGLKQPGKTYNIDGYTIIPKNLATAALYSYTPHWHGNYNFWTIMNKWFSKEFPDGSLLKIPKENTVWLLEDGIIRPIKSLAVLFSGYSPDNLIEVSPRDLERFQEGPEIKFSDYTLLKSPTGAIYLILDDTRRGITSMKAFEKMGFKMKDVIKVGWEDITVYPEKEPITESTVLPIGKLMQDTKSGGVYFVENGTKHPIPSREILKNRFPKMKMILTSPADLEKYTTGDPVKFKEGALVKSSAAPTVYVISNGERRTITSEKVFKEMGWNWKNIITTNDPTIQLHPLGEDVETPSSVELAEAN
jgi:hypothetical protein